MKTTRAPHTFFLGLFGLLSISSLAHAQITVQGLTAQAVYADRVSFRVPSTAGYEYTVELNGTTVLTDADVVVDQPNYYELSIERRQLPNGSLESLLVQFIVRSSERQNSEWGLPPWVPYPVVSSAAAEFAGARLQVIAPMRFPKGLPIPMAVWVLDSRGGRVGANGAVSAEEAPELSIYVRRGVGSGYLPAATAEGLIELTPRIGSISATTRIEVEAVTSWTSFSGNIAASTDWGENARVLVTNDVTIAAGATLTIGAGSVVRMAAGADMNVAGALQVNGTIERPVVFLPSVNGVHWGGFALRTSAARLDMTGAILTGSGDDPDWFDNNPDSGSSHRGEQPCIYLGGGARATLTDCCLIDGKGQAGHGEDSFFKMTRCLVQRFISCGQYNDGSVDFNDSALIEFPYDGAPFADDDNDALYMTGGSHAITRCLVGWALDDGLDSGSGSGGPVAVNGCWIESTYHEGMAWSEARRPTVRDTVAINCGQGIECGFGTPAVIADHILSTGNLSGARFGDNYDWTYDGTLTVTNSLLLFNARNIWGRAWDDWTEHLSKMDLRSNFLGAADPLHPDNSVWQPAVDAPKLIPFLPVPEGDVGMAIATRASKLDIAELSSGIPVRLSTFSTREVSVEYGVDSETGPLPGGTLRFVPGETVKRIHPDIADLASHNALRVFLANPSGAELTGRTELRFVRTIPIVLSPAGAVWRYLASTVSQGSAWRAPGFADGAWKSGAAELGFGDEDEETPIDGGPSGNRYPTIYFRRELDVADPSIFDSLLVRLRRDDGAIVYLNGTEIFRSNMPAGNVQYATLASGSASSETTYYTMEAPTSALAEGRNVLAVEVHQSALDSSDLSFDLELIGNSVPSIAGRFVRGDANGDGSMDISDPLKVLFVLFAGATTNCEDSLDVNDDGSLSLTDAIFVLSYLFRGGPAMPAPFPQAGADPTADSLTCGS